jgi:hypothetical protein
VQQDVVPALVNLGSKRADAERAVRKVGGDASDFDGLFRLALQVVRNWLGADMRALTQYQL